MMRWVAVLVCLLPFSADAQTTERVAIASHGWQMTGDLVLPAETPAPAVLMLNQAAGNRAPYRTLAHRLLLEGIASLRLDLPGHGESTNLGTFQPGAKPS